MKILVKSINASSIVENLNEIKEFQNNFEFYCDEDSENSFFAEEEEVELNGVANIFYKIFFSKIVFE